MNNIFAFCVMMSILVIDANASVYFDSDAEEYACNSTLPISPFSTDIAAYRGTVSCDLSPEGNKHVDFTTVDNQTNTYTKLAGPNMPILNAEGKTYYLAYYFNFTRIDGKNIWDETAGQSGDKGVEIYGNGIRWVLSRGYWGTFKNVMADHYVLWPGNPSFHIDSSIEVNDSILPNVNGYNANNPAQVKYDQWHSVVFALKVASDNTGSITVYVNGIKTFEYLNTQTAAFSNPTIDKLRLGGTIRQPTYNAPAHHRKFDKILLTDDWQDIIDAGFIKKQPKAPVLYVEQ